MALMKENVKLQIIVIENETLMKTIVKLEDEIREYTKTSLKTNEHLNKIKLKEALKQK